MFRREVATRMFDFSKSSKGLTVSLQQKDLAREFLSLLSHVFTRQHRSITLNNSRLFYFLRYMNELNLSNPVIGNYLCEVIYQGPAADSKCDIFLCDDGVYITARFETSDTNSPLGESCAAGLKIDREGKAYCFDYESLEVIAWCFNILTYSKIVLECNTRDFRHEKEALDEMPAQWQLALNC